MKMLSCNCWHSLPVSRHSFGETEEKHGSPSVSVSSSNNKVLTFNKGFRSRVYEFLASFLLNRETACCRYTLVSLLSRGL